MCRRRISVEHCVQRWMDEVRGEGVSRVRYFSPPDDVQPEQRTFVLGDGSADAQLRIGVAGRLRSIGMRRVGQTIVQDEAATSVFQKWAAGGQAGRRQLLGAHLSRKRSARCGQVDDDVALRQVGRSDDSAHAGRQRLHGDL